MASARIPANTDDILALLQPAPIIEKLGFKNLSFELENLGKKLNRASYSIFEVSQREYKNFSTKNEEALGILCDDLWLAIFTYADINSIVRLQLVCKKLAELTNDSAVQRRLYLAKEAAKKNPPLYERIKKLNLFPDLKQLGNGVSEQLIRAIDEESLRNASNPIFNPEPPDRGFVMRF